jgi:hypothetical protein
MGDVHLLEIKKQKIKFLEEFLRNDLILQKFPYF